MKSADAGRAACARAEPGSVRVRPSAAGAAALAAFALALAGWWSLDARTLDAGEPLMPGEAARGEVTTPRVQALDVPDAGSLCAAPVASTRALAIERSLVTGDAPAPAAAEETVLVHGQVRRGGLPVRFYDLEFHVDVREVDWDFTDARGRFQVRLPAGQYVVRNEADPGWSRAFVLSADQHEHVLDVDLPTRAVAQSARRSGER